MDTEYGADMSPDTLGAKDGRCLQSNQLDTLNSHTALVIHHCPLIDTSFSDLSTLSATSGQ